MHEIILTGNIALERDQPIMASNIWTGSIFNIKNIFLGIGIPTIKLRCSWEGLIFTMEIQRDPHDIDKLAFGTSFLLIT